MSKRRHKFKVIDYEALKAAYPKSVREETVVVQRPIYGYIANLLDCELPVPGIEVEGDQTGLNLNKGK
jgi:hypothetical protein